MYDSRFATPADRNESTHHSRTNAIIDIDDKEQEQQQANTPGTMSETSSSNSEITAFEGSPWTSPATTNSTATTEASDSPTKRSREIDGLLLGGPSSESAEETDHVWSRAMERGSVRNDGTRSPQRTIPPPINTTNGNAGAVPSSPPRLHRTPSPASMSPPHIARASPPPTSKIPEMPPKKNDLFSKWQEKTKSSSPVIPGKPLGSSPATRSYTGKRWKPPAKKDGAGVIAPPIMPGTVPAQSWRSSRSRTPPLPTTTTTQSLKSPSGPSDRHAASKAGRTTPSPPPSMPKATAPPPPSPLESDPPPPARKSPSAMPPTEPSPPPPPRPPADETPVISNKSPSPGPDGGAAEEPPGPARASRSSRSADDLEGELDELRELKKQLQIVQAAAGSSKAQDLGRQASERIAAPKTMKGESDDGDGSDEGGRKNKGRKAPIHSYWAHKTGQQASERFAAPKTKSGDSDDGDGSDEGGKKNKGGKAPVHSYWAHKTEKAEPLRFEKDATGKPKVPAEGGRVPPAGEAPAAAAAAAVASDRNEDDDEMDSLAYTPSASESSNGVSKATTASTATSSLPSPPWRPPPPPSEGAPAAASKAGEGAARPLASSAAVAADADDAEGMAPPMPPLGKPPTPSASDRRDRGAGFASAVTARSSQSSSRSSTPARASSRSSTPLSERSTPARASLSSTPLSKSSHGSRGSSTRASSDGAAGGGVLVEFRTLVEELVRQVMPTEIDHIDELIEEYEGREAELLDTLTAMREDDDLLSQLSETRSHASDDVGGDGGASVVGVGVAAVAAGAGLPSLLSPEPSDNEPTHASSPQTSSGGPGRSSRGIAQRASPRSVDDSFDGSVATEHTSNARSAKRAGARIVEEDGDDGADDATPPQARAVLIGDGDAKGMSQAEMTGRRAADAAVVATPTSPPQDQHAAADVESQRAQDHRDEEEKEAERRRKRKWACIAFAVVFLLLAGAAAAVGVVLGARRNESEGSAANEALDDGEFVARPDEIPYIGGEATSAGREPAAAPVEAGGREEAPTGNDDGFDPNAPPTPCNTLPAGRSGQDLGVRALQGNYPKVAVDGNQAVVASGSGYVAFYVMDEATGLWSRSEVFGTMVNVGDIHSVAISGNTAVVGAPEASTNLSPSRLQTGAIYIYEKDETTNKWRQLRGAYIPEEYQRGARAGQYRDAGFGKSVDIDGDLIVAGAPEENSNEGSITVFRRDGSEWREAARRRPDRLCPAEFYGYSVHVRGDTIAASADCEVNVELFRFEREGDDGDAGAGGTLVPFQQLRYVSPFFGAVSSIGMSRDTLVYSTVSGGLFWYKLQNRDEDDAQYFLSQEMSFDGPANLYHYPLSADADMLALSVANEIYLYTTVEGGASKWKRERLVLQSKGDYAGYVGASVALSGGRVLVAEKREVAAYDLSGCATEPPPPSPMPTFSPTSAPSATPRPPEPPTCLNVNLYFDRYPSDTSWNIRDSEDGSVVARSPEYDPDVKTVSPQVCLPEGDYEFTIFDVYGDGMCCKWGEGSYNLTSSGGALVARGGAFGANETTPFSMPFDPEDAPVLPWQSDGATPGDAKPGPTKRPTPSPTPRPNGSPTTAAPTPLPTPLPTLPPTLPPTVPPTPDPTLQPTSPPTAPPSQNPSLPPTSPPTASPTSNPTVGGPPAPCYSLDVTVTLDQYPSDTRWEIKPQGQSEVLFESPPYDNSLMFLSDAQSVCLEEGTYDFSIYDVYGDGICCDWGQGSYQLAFEGSVVAEGGSFGPSETVPFATPGSDGASATDPPTPSPPDCAGHLVIVDLNFDQYPVDTSWDVSRGGVVVERSPPYDGSTRATEELCLPPGEYVFTIYDVYQDGMCCDWGRGSYSVTTGDGTVIKEGGEFGASESMAIALPP